MLDPVKCVPHALRGQITLSFPPWSLLVAPSPGESSNTDDTGIALTLTPAVSSMRWKALHLSFQPKTHFWTRVDIIINMLIFLAHPTPPLPHSVQTFVSFYTSAIFFLCCLKGCLHSWGKSIAISTLFWHFVVKTDKTCTFSLVHSNGSQEQSLQPI